MLLASYTLRSYCKSYIIYQLTISLISVDFLLSLIFNVLFADTYRNAIYNYTIHKNMQQKFVSAILEEIEALFTKMVLQPAMESALFIYHQWLKSFWPQFTLFKSHKSCFYYLIKMPEKVFNCKHIIYNMCIKTFG